MKRGDRDERQRFADEITTINLQRQWWVSVTTVGVTASLLGFSLLSERRELLGVECLDALLSAVLITLIWRARQDSPPARWARGLVIAYVVLMLAITDFYFFSSLPTVGHHSTYVIGVMICGVLMLLPPGVFLPMLLTNHVIYCVLVLAAGRGRDFAVAAIFDGSTGVLVAGLASYFLYTAQWENFRKGSVIAQRNRELAAANAELTRRNEEMNELMAIAAHDLRSPLEGQKNLLQLALSRVGPGGERLGEMLRAARESCRGMLGLVGRILEAHQAEHEASVPSSAIDIKPVVASAAERQRSCAAAKGIVLTLALPEGEARAEAEAGSLDQVLDNLIANAIKFSPPGAEIEVALERGPYWTAEVRDRGPGVPPEERAGLFRKFQRGSAQPTAGEPSTGLGLFIVRTRVEAMRGRISHVPREGGGSIFRVELPVAR